MVFGSQFNVTVSMEWQRLINLTSKLQATFKVPYILRYLLPAREPSEDKAGPDFAFFFSLGLKIYLTYCYEI